MTQGNEQLPKQPTGEILEAGDPVEEALQTSFEDAAEILARRTNIISRLGTLSAEQRADFGRRLANLDVGPEFFRVASDNFEQVDIILEAGDKVGAGEDEVSIRSYFETEQDRLKPTSSEQYF